MVLDNLEEMRKIDQSNMLLEIQTLPDQLEKAWQIAEKYDLPKFIDYESITIAGMGGSAIGADLLASYIVGVCRTPVNVIRGYSLPEWISTPQSLIICSSHSGNTEETLSVYNQARDRDCTVMAVSTGGKLKSLSESNRTLFWQFDHEGQPRAAVGYSFGMLLNLFSRMKWIPDQKDLIKSVAEAMRKTLMEIDADIPVSRNLSKRIAGQVLDRQAVIFGAEHLEPVARRWKTQINEVAKAWAGFEFLSEADHNTLAGLEYPSGVLEKIYALFLSSDNYNPRMQKRFDLTQDHFMAAGLNTDNVKIYEEDRLSEIWRILLIGDFVSYYLAMLYGVDPTPIASLEGFKQEMKS